MRKRGPNEGVTHSILQNNFGVYSLPSKPKVAMPLSNFPFFPALMAREKMGKAGESEIRAAETAAAFSQQKQKSKQF